MVAATWRPGSVTRSLSAYSALTGQILDQALRFRFLARRTFADDFLENAARAFWIAHVHVGSSQVQLGSHFAHRYRFQFRKREIVGLDLAGARGGDRFQLVG